MLGNALILLLGIASLQVWAVIWRRWRRGQPLMEAAPRSTSPWWRVSALVAGVYVVLLSSTGTPGTVEIRQVQQGTLFGMVEIVVALAFLTGGFRTRLADIGLRRTGLGRQMSDGVFAFLASLLPVFLLLLVTYGLRTPENQHPYLKLLREAPTPLNIAWLMFGAVVIAPVREELIFRVMLQEGLSRRLGPAPAIGIVAVLFCLVHGFPDSLALFPLAVILGYVYHQRQSAIAVIVTHALFNLTNVTILLLGTPDQVVGVLVSIIRL